MISEYYWLAKPGIIYGNLLSAIAGFFLGWHGDFDWRKFLSMLIGLSFVIGSGCVFNNIYDRDIDHRMERTKNRPLVTGSISIRNAIIFGAVLGILGAGILFRYTNPLSLAVASAGWIIYLGFYTPMKHRSIHATLMGSLAGAVPPVVGYTAATHKFDLGAILLFLILVAWQMPHFYSIAIRRLDDYTRAKVPVLPLVKGIKTTKNYVTCYVTIYLIVASLLFLFKYTGGIYALVVGLLGLYWLWLAFRGYKPHIDNKLWARKMFLTSLVILLAQSVAIVVDSIINNKL